MSSAMSPQSDESDPGDVRRHSPITREILESYLNCKLKGHLKLKGERGTKSDYEMLMAEGRVEQARRASEKLVARPKEDEVLRGIEVSIPVLKRGVPLILDATVKDVVLSVKIDGLRRVDGPSRLGGFHYVPILFVEGEKIRREQRQLLELCGLIIGDIQGKQPAYGIVVRGKGLTTGKIQFKAGSRSSRRELEEIKKLQDAASPPKLILNDHCQVCEFKQKCRLQAVNEDNLSLLRGMGEKEIRNCARKGLFTLTQLAHTFRPRRKGKRVVPKGHKRYHALNALAIRDKRIYVLGTPQVPANPVTIFLDVEGKPEEGFDYLIGMVVVRDGSEEHHSFWADTQDQEPVIFEQFLDEIERLDDFVVFCYGGYEKAFLTRLRRKTERKDLVDKVLKALVNVLSLVYSHLYFPTYSNGLKDVAGCLDFSWSEEEASGVQSIAWRMRWESTHTDVWKQTLTTYNLEDCLALKKVTEFVQAIRTWADAGANKPLECSGGPQVALVHEIDKLAHDRKWGRNRFVHPEFSFINECAYFDYQRERVFVRTSKILRKRKKIKKTNNHNRKLRKYKDYIIVSANCPSCKSGKIDIKTSGKADIKASRVKRAFDLVVTPGGVKRRVIECRAPIHRCGACGQSFIPAAYRNLDKHFHSLKSWAMYFHVAHQTSFGTLEELFKELFDITINKSEFQMIKNLLAETYRTTYRRLLAKILSGQVVLVDETEVKLKTGKGYVWVFASLEEVVYIFRPTREGDFLRELLKDFHGVLVSDFYAAYDAIDCPQQKCLIHLMRDINQDLLSNPFDKDLLSITQPFGTLLQSIVSSVDQHGLQKKHLMKHVKEVESFFRLLTEKTYSSEVAESLRERLLKNQEKLFTFIRYDGVPWNNNCAENAVKRFAYYREDTAGLMTEAGLNDYLVLLSIYQTCRYKGVSFLRFLLSREQDLDVFCEKKRPKQHPPLIEVYPEGFIPPHFVKLWKRRQSNDTSGAVAQIRSDGDPTDPATGSPK